MAVLFCHEFFPLLRALNLVAQVQKDLFMNKEGEAGGRQGGGGK